MSLTTLYPLTDLFWYQDRPLVGLPPMPGQFYRPPDNDVRRCSGPCPQKVVNCPRRTIMEWNYGQNDYKGYPDHKKACDPKSRKEILQAMRSYCKN